MPKAQPEMETTPPSQMMHDQGLKASASTGRSCQIETMEEAIMALLRPLDPAFPIERQLAIDASPVVLVNVFTLDKADEQTFLQAWQDDAVFMKRQPGFISTQLHRAIGESPTYLNYAVWESTASFRAAFTHPEFRAKLSAYPSSAVAFPHLFQKVAAPVSASRSSLREPSTKDEQQ
jgi:heme-degrading monooxygenase HmoA